MKQLFKVIAQTEPQNTNFDQAIIETSNGKDFWIHVSCRKNKSKNRHQVIRDLRKK